MRSIASFSLLTLAVLVLLMASCDRQMRYDEYREVDKGEWSWIDGQEFNFDIQDTVSLHNIYLKVRHSVEYPYSNLYMFVHVKGPDNQYIKDTVNFILAQPDGDWNGRGNTRLRELNLLYRKNARFRIPGNYSITLEQAMRKEILPVSTLGVRIERIKAD